MQSENAELQKQVDALKGDYVKGYEAGVDEGWDNAAKETAEDILKFAKPFIDIKEFISACAEVWGVDCEDPQEEKRGPVLAEDGGKRKNPPFEDFD